MKKITLLPVLLINAMISYTQTLPAEFSWPVTGVKDQKENGPCNIFATTAAVESWLLALYGTDVSLSEAHLYSPCGNANPAPSTSITHAMNFFKNTGVVKSSCIPYVTGNACTGSNPPTQSLYYSFTLGNATTSPSVTNNRLYNNDCGTPYCNCIIGSFPDDRYRIGDFAALDFQLIADGNGLKRALMNYGPIAIRMTVNDANYPELHVGSNHTYLLYGWQTDGKWKLKDSWQNNAKLNNATSFNIVSFFKNQGNGEAWYIKKGIIGEAVYRQTYAPPPTNVWTTISENTICANSAYSNAFNISTPSNTISGTPVTASVSNIGLLDNPTVEWSFEGAGTGGGAVSFTPTVGSSVTVSAIVSGQCNLVAKIKRPNGLCETIRKLVTTNVAPASIPFTYTKIFDGCVAGKRRIQYQVACSPNNNCGSLSCAWDFRPSPGTTYTTSISNCTFTVDFSTFNKSYGLLVNVTSSLYPGVTGQGTAGGPVNPCAAFRSAPGSNSTQEAIAVENFVVYPNPANKKLNVNLPRGGDYTITLINSTGMEVKMKTSAGGTVSLNVQGYSKGLYFVKVLDRRNKAASVIKKVMIE